jgi:hypothetical protein
MKPAENVAPAPQASTALTRGAKTRTISLPSATRQPPFASVMIAVWIPDFNSFLPSQAGPVCLPAGRHRSLPGRTWHAQQIFSTHPVFMSVFEVDEDRDILASGFIHGTQDVVAVVPVDVQDLRTMQRERSAVSRVFRICGVRCQK